jgi:hypothetical protein
MRVFGAYPTLLRPRKRAQRMVIWWCSFPIYFYCFTLLLLQPLTYRNQPKMLVASAGHLVVFNTNIQAYRMKQIAGSVGGTSGLAWLWCSAVRVSFESRPGHSPGVSKVFFSPSIQMPEQSLYETTTASFQIISNSPFINDTLIRRCTVTPRSCVSR